MKLIFLDVDGVLNHSGWLGKRGDTDLPVDSPEWFALELDSMCVSRLNELITRTGAKVVVSSVWRCGKTIGSLQAILECAGFTGEVIGKTPHLGGERGEEIAEWLEDSHKLYGLEPFESFVILDDDSDMGALIPFLVQTSFESGLQQDHVERAVSLLGEKQ